MSLKTLIFFGLLAVALGFTLPEQEVDGPYAEVLPIWAYNGEEIPAQEDVVLIRRARSPQRRFEGRFEHSRQMGSSASLGYTHPINKNWEAYAGASRNFKFNDNSGHAGLRFKF